MPGTSQFNKNVSCINNKDAKVLTASLEQDESSHKYTLVLWEDAVFTGKTSVVPFEPISDSAEAADDSDYCVCRDISPYGYVIVSAQAGSENEWRYLLYDVNKDEWIDMDYMSSNKNQVLGMAESHPLMAVQGEDGNLSLIDFSSGKETLSFGNTLTGGSITKLIFANNDEWLIAFNNSGKLAIYSTKDGKELHHSSYGKQNLSFKGNAYYNVYLIPEKDRMLILYDDYDLDINYTKPIAITIDTATMKQSGLYPEISCYFPSTNKVLINYNYEEPCFCKLYSLEEMQEKAEKLLNGTEN